MHTVLEGLQQIFVPDRIASRAANFIPDFILALIVFSIFYLLYRLLSSVLTRLAKRVGMGRTAAGFLLSAGKYIILIFGAMMALRQIGISVTSIFAGLGITGLSLGFAANEDIGKARDMIPSIVGDDDRFLKLPPPDVAVTQLGDYYVELQ